MANQINPFRGVGSPRFWGEGGGEGGYHPRYPARRKATQSTRKSVTKARPAPEPIPKVDGKSAAAGEKDDD